MSTEDEKELSEIKPHLSYKEQLELFKNRGLTICDEISALKKIEHINYYKIKEFAEPFVKNNKKDEFEYHPTEFDFIINRFYIDKEIRLNLLHATEKIELSFKNKVAYILGEKSGDTYKEPNKWCDKKIFKNKEKAFLDFIKKVDKIVSDRKDSNINVFLEENPTKKYPPIWMLINVFDFGTSVFLYNLMNEDLKKEIAVFYNCSHKELTNWINHINFVRNMCAHNSKIIDFSFYSKVTLRKRWTKNLYFYTNAQNELVLTNKIVVTLCVLKYLIPQINHVYSLDKIFEELEKLTNKNDDLAMKFGFKDYDSIEKLKNEILT